MAPLYKLHYFNIRCRGELIRWEFAYAGQAFEDNRVDQYEFHQGTKDSPPLKTKTPLGQLPYLEVDGKPLAQSMTICRFIARKYGFVGENAWEEALVDQLVDYVSDAAVGYNLWLDAYYTNDPKVDTIKEEYVSKGVLPFLAGLERLLESNNSGTGYFVGSKPTWGDLDVAVFLDQLISIKPDCLDKCPLLKAHFHRVQELKGIKEYLAKRPVTLF